MGGLLNILPDDGKHDEPDEGELGFVIQVGPRLFGGDAGLFDSDDDAHAWATRKGYPRYDIRPVLPS